MGVIGRARALLALGPAVAARRAGAFAARRARAAWNERRDRGGTFAHPADVPAELPFRYFSLPPLDALRGGAERIAALAELYRAHRFDLLGSGWVRVEHGMRCAGVEGHVYPPGPAVRADAEGRWLRGRIDPGNLAESVRVWRLVDAGYRPIDWQLDFKSGYRWSESAWHGRIRYGHRAGVDVKVPWELARMQHLPQLAWAHALARAGEPGLAPAEAYAREFRNQVLDFVATNPPRFGVNWTTAMDVAIRVASWLVARDLFLASGAEFDAAFEAELARSVHAHGAHLVRHLEWNGGARGNHYLADVAGLLFVAAYLPRSGEADAWLAFAVQELVSETEHQFTPDGACFESSTAYHRLSAEMVVYATALTLGLGPEKRAAMAEYDAARHRARPPLRPAPLSLHALPRGGASPFGPSYVERVQRMAEFTRDVTRPDGRVHQVGDNDSGRFLRLWPEHRPVPVREARRRLANLAGWDGLPDDAVYWEEDALDHRHLVAAADGLFARAHFAAFAPAHPEREMVRALAGGARFAAAAREGTAAAAGGAGTDAEWARAWTAVEAPGVRRTVWSIPLPPGAGAGERYAYPWFGLYILRFAGFYLAVRCGGAGQEAHGAHAHNDQLAVELQAPGTDPVRDPGTYLYTPLPERRNAYRSARAHHAPRGGEDEPAPLDRGLFELEAVVRGECLYWGPRGFAGTYRGWGEPVYRIVEVMDNEVRVTDAGRTLQPAADPPPFSPAYGVRHA
ncbi:MAG TPA: heparinase II/III family protein [Longimicrobium sp.]|nr:heparinase II/III family protein [Longimicrobium sp.]